VSLETSRYQLHSAFKTARLRWEDTCQQWNDGVRQDFEKDFWSHVEPTVLGTLSALDRLAVVIAKLKQECRGGGLSIHGE
jgi:hypothetical protein